MASSLSTKLRIAGSVLFATGFFDAVAGRVLWAPGVRDGVGSSRPHPPAPSPNSPALAPVGEVEEEKREERDSAIPSASLPRITPPSPTGSQARELGEGGRGDEGGGAQHSSLVHPLLDIAGAVHVHSTYSDGAGDIPTVMDAAREAGVDFVLLTDHNTQQPLRDGWEERYAGQTPFLLIGTEVTVEHGAFLLALDMPAEWEPIKHEVPQVSIDRVREKDGLALVSLPFDVKHPWRDWDATGYMGLEVVNVSTVARRHINLLSLAWLLPLNKLRGPMAVLRALLTRPDQAMARWDDLTRGGRRRMVGLGALDAHALMKVGKKKHPIPSYADSFRTATTHFQVPAAAAVPEAGLEARRRAVYDALREGRCYIAYDCLARPAGFTFTATDGAGRCAAMGAPLAHDPARPLRFTAEVTDGGPAAPDVPRNVLLRLLRDGTVIASQTGGRLDHTEERPAAGAYRVEAYRYAFRFGPLVFGARPWLFGNPIYVS